MKSKGLTTSQTYRLKIFRANFFYDKRKSRKMTQNFINKQIAIANKPCLENNKKVRTWLL